MKHRLAGADEHLDESAHNPAELEESLDQVAAVNRFLGGTRAAVHAVLDHLPSADAAPRAQPRAQLDAASPQRPVRIVDVGCGSGDVTLAIARALERRGRSAFIVAADLHPQILDLARRRLAAAPAIRLVRLDARALPFRTQAFDVAVMSLTLHHFESDDPVRVLRELGRVAHIVVINDLERCWQNLVGAQLLAHTVWARNRLTRHDGPLSVRRAFTAPELASIARAAGLRNVEVRRRFFYRLVLTAASAQRHGLINEAGPV